MRKLLILLLFFTVYIIGIFKISNNIKSYKNISKEFQAFKYEQEVKAIFQKKTKEESKKMLKQSQQYFLIAKLLEAYHLEQHTHKKDSDHLIKSILYSFFGSDLFFTKKDFYFLKQKHSYKKIYDTGAIVLYNDLRKIINSRADKLIVHIKNQKIILNKDLRRTYSSNKISLNKNEDFIIEESMKSIKKESILLYLNFIENHPTEDKKMLLEKAIKITKDSAIEKLTDLKSEDVAFYFNVIINGLANSYDSHSQYMDKERVKDFYLSLDGSFSGIGIDIENDAYANRYVIKSIINGGPAEKSNLLKEKDTIIAIKDLKTNFFSEIFTNRKDYNLFLKIIKNNIGYPIELTVKSKDGMIKKITLMRDSITPEDARISSMVYKDLSSNQLLGYIKIPSFYGRSSIKSVSEDFLDALFFITNNHAQGLIIDLQDNTGGLLDQAVGIASTFITSNPIVQLKHPKDAITILNSYLSDPKPTFSKPVVVMINSFSASASEILSGALQDYNKALIVGSSQSYGKGTVQSIIPLNATINDEDIYESSGVVKITSQKFYRVNGKTNQYSGITPDILIDIPLLRPRFEKNDEFSLKFDTIPSAKFKTDIHDKKIKNNILQNSKTRLSKNKKLNDYKKVILNMIESKKLFQSINSEQLNNYIVQSKKFENEKKQILDSTCKNSKCKKYAILKEKGFIEPNLFNDFIFEESSQVLRDMIHYGY